MQDYWVAMEIEKNLFGIAFKFVDVSVNAVPSISKSGKGTANLTASNYFKAVGASYMITARKLQVSPRLETIEKYQAMTGDLLALIKFFDGKPAAVLFKTIERFLRPAHIHVPDNVRRQRAAQIHHLATQA